MRNVFLLIGLVVLSIPCGRQASTTAQMSMAAPAAPAIVRLEPRFDKNVFKVW